MKKISAILISLCILLAANLIAKELAFKVLAVKGEVMFQHDGKGKWDKIYTGSQVFRQDKIKLADNCYIGLMHVKGKTYEISKAGEFEIEPIADKVSFTKTEVSKPLIDYILNQIGGNNDILSKAAKKKGNKVGGAAERGGLNNDSPIKFYGPEKIYLLKKDHQFYWNNSENKASFVFNIKDQFDKNVFSKSLTDTIFNIKDANLKSDLHYFCYVANSVDSQQNSADICFKIISEADADTINANLKDLYREYGNETALSRIMIALFYENNLLFDEAFKEYREAIRRSPDVPSYRSLYEDFLIRNNFRKDLKKELKPSKSKKK